MSAPCPIFGFVLRARVVGESADALRASLLELLGPNGLEIADIARGLEYLISREGSQATNADREIVLEWAKSWIGVAEIEVSDLFDLQQVN